MIKDVSYISIVFEQEPNCVIDSFCLSSGKKGPIYTVVLFLYNKWCSFCLWHAICKWRNNRLILEFKQI